MCLTKVAICICFTLFTFDKTIKRFVMFDVVIRLNWFKGNCMVLQWLVNNIISFYCYAIALKFRLLSSQTLPKSLNVININPELKFWYKGVLLKQGLNLRLIVGVSKRFKCFIRMFVTYTFPFVLLLKLWNIDGAN